MAGVGTLAVLGVLVGLQCGGLDRCFAGMAKDVAPVVEPVHAAEARVPEERLVADQVVAETPQARPAQPDQRTRQIAALIGGSFDAIRADDEGWLTGAYSPSAPPEALVDEGDGPGPVVTPAAAVAVPAAAPASLKSGKEAVAAIAALDQPATSPDELSVTAFADPTAEAADDAVEEEEPRPIAAVQSGRTGTVAGSGANVRSGPGKSNATLFALAGGKKVTVGEDKGGWLKVTDEQDRTGWIYKTYIN